MKFSRQQVWMHNAMSGWAAMMAAQLVNIIASKTATDETKALASNILADVRKLKVLIKTRRDQE